MNGHKIQTMPVLREEMKAVARGERPAPDDAARPSHDSARALAEWIKRRT